MRALVEMAERLTEAIEATSVEWDEAAIAAAHAAQESTMCQTQAVEAGRVADRLWRAAKAARDLAAALDEIAEIAAQLR